MRNHDRGAREAHARVERLDRRIVPGLDLAQEDVGDRRTVELQPSLYVWQVVGKCDRTERDRELEHRPLHLREVLRLQLPIVTRKVCGGGLQVRNPGARTDRGVVDGQALRLEGRAPL